MNATDYRGAPLREGDRVEAWLSGSRYTATVRTIKRPTASDGETRRIVLVRDDDGTERDCYSDAIVVLDTDPTKEQER